MKAVSLRLMHRCVDDYDQDGTKVIRTGRSMDQKVMHYGDFKSCIVEFLGQVANGMILCELATNSRYSGNSYRTDQYMLNIYLVFG
jgi:hypothetical protein